MSHRLTISLLFRRLARVSHGPTARPRRTLTFVRGPRCCRHGAVAPEGSLGVRDGFLQLHVAHQPGNQAAPGGSTSSAKRLRLGSGDKRRFHPVTRLRRPATLSIFVRAFELLDVWTEVRMQGACAVAARLCELGRHPVTRR